MASKNSSEVESPSVIDALVDDANPPEYPAGAPELQPYLRIRPRSRRAEFKRQFAKFETVKQKIDEIRASGVFDASGHPDAEVDQGARLRAWAEMDDMYQQMDDVLALAAVDPDAYRAWSDAAEDDDLTLVFNVYMRTSQPGEASSSAS